MMPQNPLSSYRLGLIALCFGAVLAFGPGFACGAGQSAEPTRPAASAAVPTPVSEEETPQTGLPEAYMAVGNQVYHIEVASTPAQSEKGLMYRTSLPQGYGMLFPFNPPRPVSFWMKNTKIPLDILFFANGRLLRAFQDVQPCLSVPCPAYGVPGLIDMVLELPAGTARRDHLTVGMSGEVRWPVPVKSSEPSSSTSAPKGN
jgi:uncharacterized membrane protein (UPF0127 family)